jgi:hypothetical protein
VHTPAALRLSPNYKESHILLHDVSAFSCTIPLKARVASRSVGGR